VEIAGLVLNGVVCEECGNSFGEGMGHPRRYIAFENLQSQTGGAEEDDSGEETPFA